MSESSLRSLAVFVILLAIPTVCLAKIIPEVIYGNDSRQDVFQLSDADQVYKRAARGTALISGKRSLRFDRLSGLFDLKTYSLGQAHNVCADEPFEEQPTLGWCSGFLVADNILVTAGHCVGVRSSCHDTQVVFDFAYRRGDEELDQLHPSSVYSCKKVLHRAFGGDYGLDFAILELDRATQGRPILEMRSSGKVKRYQEMTVIGHPVGLPTKIAAGSFVRSNREETFFSINSDTFGGSSGSPVIGTDGLVEGVLARGEVDFVRRGGCQRSLRCNLDSCQGEEVVRSSHIMRVLKKFL